jgi:WD40 repeat protein
MSEPAFRSLSSLPPDEARLVDDLCARFEDDWKKGERPRIEDYQPEVREAVWPALFRELLALEVVYRVRQGEQPRLEDYRARFPQFEEQLAPLLVELLAEQASVVARKSLLPATVPEAASSPSAWTYAPSIPGYDILSEVGKGGQGVVYKAWHQGLKRHVVLKMIRPDRSLSEAEQKRFETDANTISQFQNPHIVQIHDIGKWKPEGSEQSLPYFVLEFCPGGSLARKLAATPQQPTEAAKIVETLARAVQVAHDKNIIHRDLKPANVLIDADGRLKITDFGLAKKLDDAGQSYSGAIFGSPPYMAPEQATGRTREVGKAADVYALGAILYECLTGRPPFKGASDLDTLFQVVHDDPVPPSGLQPKVPRDLETVCLTCLHKERARRYGSAAELADDLGRFLCGEPILGRRAAAWERAARWVRRHPSRAALTAVGAVAVLASVGLVVGLVYNRELEGANGRLAQALDDVQNEKKETERQRTRAREAEAKARRFLYDARMALVQRAEQEKQPRRVVQLLRSLIPESPDQEDLRGWEWHHLWRKYHGEQSQLHGHRGAVTAVAFSPDGKLLASGSADQTIKLWDTATGKEVFTLKGHRDRVTGVTFSPDGKRLLSASADKTAKIWDVTTKELLSQASHQTRVTCVAFSRDGRHAASGSDDGIVLVWDAQTGQTVTTFRGETGAFPAFTEGARACAYQVGRTVGLIGSSQGEGPLLATSELFRSAQQYVRMAVTGVAFGPDGKTVASMSRYRGVSGATGEVVFFGPGGEIIGVPALWSDLGGQDVLRLGGKQDGASVAFNSDGKHLATREVLTAGRDQPPTAVLLWDLDSPNVPLSLQGHTGLITCLAFSPNGKYLASSSLDQTVRIWDVAAGKETSVLPEEAGVLAVAISPDARRIAVGSEEGTVRLWTPPGNEVLNLSPGGALNNVVFSPDGRRLAASSSNGAVTVWDTGTGEKLRRFAASQYLRVAWSPDGQILGVGGRFVDLLTGESRRTLPVSEDLYGTAFSPDGKLFATATGLGGSARVWDRGTGACLNTFTSGRGWSSCVAFSPDGKWLAAGSGGMNRSSSPVGSLNVWDLRTSQRVFSFDDMAKSVWGVAFSPDGKRLAAATGYYGTRDPGEVRVWDTTTGSELYRLKGHVDCVWSVTFNPDGCRLASAAGQWGRGTLPGEVKVWDMNTGQEVYTLRGHARVVHGVAFSPDGRRLATASADGAVKIWDGAPLAETPAYEPLPDDK